MLGTFSDTCLWSYFLAGSTFWCFWWILDLKNIASWEHLVQGHILQFGKMLQRHPQHPLYHQRFFFVPRDFVEEPESRQRSAKRNPIHTKRFFEVIVFSGLRSSVCEAMHQIGHLHIADTLTYEFTASAKMTSSVADTTTRVQLFTLRLLKSKAWGNAIAQR